MQHTVMNGNILTDITGFGRRSPRNVYVSQALGLVGYSSYSCAVITSILNI